MLSLDNEDFPPLPSQQRRQPASPPQPLSTTLRIDRVVRSSNTLADLPNELLFMVLDYLSGTEGPVFFSAHVHNSESEYYRWLGRRLRYLRIMKSLSLTCHRLHNVVATRLYSNYDSSVGSPYLFLRTLITNPHVARMVQSVTFSRYAQYRGRPTPYEPTISDRGIIKSGLKSMDTPGWKSWATACNEGIHQEYILAAILKYTTNVKTIIYSREGMGMPPLWLHHIKFVTSRSYFGYMHDAAHLERIHIGAQTLSFSELAPLFRLPSLRRLTLEGLEDDHMVGKRPGKSPKWTLAPGTFSLEELSLPGCFIHSRNLAKLLNASRYLKMFSYTYPNDRPSHVPSPLSDTDRSFIHHPTVYAALRGSRTTLEGIEYMPAFCDDCDIPAHFTYGHREGPLGSFVDFPRLSSIKGTLGAFADVRRGPDATLADELPRALTEIRLFVGCQVERQSILALQHLAETFPTYLPNLSVVDVNVLASTRFDRNCLDWSRVRKLFAESDVKYRLETHYLFEDEVEAPDEEERGNSSAMDSDSEESEYEPVYEE